jgi:hypothetical protein
MPNCDHSVSCATCIKSRIKFVIDISSEDDISKYWYVIEELEILKKTKDNEIKELKNKLAKMESIFNKET